MFPLLSFIICSVFHITSCYLSLSQPTLFSFPPVLHFSLSLAFFFNLTGIKTSLRKVTINQVIAKAINGLFSRVLFDLSVAHSMLLTFSQAYSWCFVWAILSTPTTSATLASVVCLPALHC